MGGVQQGEERDMDAHVYGERRIYFSGQHMWARGYFVSMVGLDEEKVRKYIKEQEKSDAQLDLITI